MIRLGWAFAIVLTVACGSEEAAPEPACVHRLNQPRTILDGDRDCPSAPQRVVCAGTQAANALFPNDFVARYHPDGRLARYGWFDDRGVGPDWTELDHFGDGRLRRIGARELTYDDEARLASLVVAGVERRTFHYDDRDRLIRIEDPMGYHGTTHFEWSDDGWLERMRSEGEALVIQTFSPDEHGRLGRHLVQFDDGEPMVRDFRYEDGDLVEMGGTDLFYTDSPLDVPPTNGMHRAWFIEGAQKELFIRTGSEERPWRVYLGDHPNGWVAAYPEHVPAHRPFGSYESGDDGVIFATVSRGNTHDFEFAPVSHCPAE